MNINLIVVQKPAFVEYNLLGSINIEQLKKNKTVRISPSFHTKTRVSTVMQIGNNRNGINFPIDNFKTFESKEHSYFTSEVQTLNYFVKSKTQNFEAYKEYVKRVVEKALVEYINVELDEVTIELETWDENYFGK